MTTQRQINIRTQSGHMIAVQEPLNPDHALSIYIPSVDPCAVSLSLSEVEDLIDAIATLRKTH